ncbi:MAG: AraC family transcriptional regulator [Phycisphaerae bacterium]
MKRRKPASPPHHSSSASPAGEPEFFSTQIAQAKRFYLDLERSTAERLEVVCGGCEHCAADYHVSRNDFRYYSIEFVARGHGDLRLQNRDYRLGPGDILAYGPDIAHNIRSDPANPLVKYFVDFVGRQAVELLRPPGPVPGQLIQTSAPDEVMRLYDDLISTGLRPTPFRDRLCAVILEHLLLRIAETAVAPGTIGTLAFESYQRCRQYLDEHYLTLHNLAELAAACHADPAYICRLFNRFDYQSPYQYLIRLKMLDAAQRLQTPGTLVKQVAAQMGFTDPFQFSRSFRRVLGVSPRQFVSETRP